MIDWSKLKSYRASHTQSFEQLCYQVANTLYGDQGNFTSIDDTGGGDGVEFFLTLPNGDEWGWQAKFFHPSPRLAESNRKAQITKSFGRACEKHPKLTKWFLCTPTDFTPEERRWFSQLQLKDKPDLELKHWGDSDFNKWMSEPRFTGKRNYFFGELELSLDWFRIQVERQTASVRDKFNENLHLATDADARIHSLLGDKEAAEAIRQYLRQTTDVYDGYAKAINELQNISRFGRQFDWNNLEAPLVAAAETTQTALDAALAHIRLAHSLLHEQKIAQVRQLDIEGMTHTVQGALDAYEGLLDAFDFTRLTHQGEAGKQEDDLQGARRLIYSPRRYAASLLDLLKLIASQLNDINKTELHMLGDAGYGKTHLACHICAERIEAGLPALLIPGGLFRTSATPEEQLRQILDIPPAYSWNDFVQALAAAAEAYGTRIPLVIDGLNEATANGLFSPIWSQGLPSLTRGFGPTGNVALITTCRRTYQNVIWGAASGQDFAYLYGFDDDVTEAAVERYFAWYKIRAAVTAAPLDQFRHPIYLKLFCESTNQTRQNEVEVHLGEYTLFQVFNNFLAQCNKVVCQRLHLHSSVRVVEPALIRVAARLWEDRERSLPFAQLVEIMDGQPLESLDYESSKTKAILDEGLLVYRDWREAEEIVFFTYDLMAGYLIAKHLLAEAEGDMDAFFNTNDIMELLFSDDYGTLHALAGDIGRSLAALMPVQTERYLTDVVQRQTVVSLFVDSLFEIPPQHVQQRCVDYITYLFSLPQNRQLLLERSSLTAIHIDHPLNVRFWSSLLRALPMAERDISWSEYVRQNMEHFSKVVQRFEGTCRQPDHITPIATARLHLFAEYLRWTLTSTIRPLRDKVTRALYWYGRRFPQQFISLVQDSFDINDPYVAERMLAATYGVAMARQHDFEDPSFAAELLPDIGRRLYHTMFQPEAPYGTTHVLARDYARYTIEIALKHQPTLLTVEEQSLIRPPFVSGRIREWGQSEDRNKGEYREGNALLGMDFKNYTLADLVQNRQNYDFDHPDYKIVLANIFWRVYELGYSLEAFGQIDQRLQRANWNYGRSTDGGKTDRYGKKYSWIAFFELYGFRQDTSAISPDVTSHPTDCDIDPSFPEADDSFMLISTDFLEPKDVNVQEWIVLDGPPDLEPYLIMVSIQNEQGPWVLLDGYMSQMDKAVKRKCFFNVTACFVQAADADAFMQDLQQGYTGSHWTRAPEDHYTYASEIPWCETYGYNGWNEEAVTVDMQTASEEREELIFSREGRPATNLEVAEFWASEEVAEISDDMEALPNALQKFGLTVTMKPVRSEHKNSYDNYYNVLLPTRSNNWESHHSTITPGRAIVTPAREITDALRLCGQPQTFDLFETNGRRASVSTHYGEAWQNQQHFCYLRQDLLERFLSENKLQVVWVISGERSFFSVEDTKHNFDEIPTPYQNFNSVKFYSKRDDDTF